MNGRSSSRKPKRFPSPSVETSGARNADLGHSSLHDDVSCVDQLTTNGDSQAAKKLCTKSPEVISRQVIISVPPESERRAIKILILIPSLPRASPPCEKKVHLPRNREVSFTDPDETDLSSCSDQEVGQFSESTESGVTSTSDPGQSSDLEDTASSSSNA